MASGFQLGSYWHNGLAIFWPGGPQAKKVMQVSEGPHIEMLSDLEYVCLVRDILVCCSQLFADLG